MGILIKGITEGKTDKWINRHKGIQKLKQKRKGK